MTKFSDCKARYAPIDDVENGVVLECASDVVRLTTEERTKVIDALQQHVEKNAQTAKREFKRHVRRIKELRDQQQKLVHLYYRDGVSEEVLQAEQARIKEEQAQVQRWATAATQQVDDVMDALREALSLLDRQHASYRYTSPIQRRLLNQALFSHIFVIDGDTIEVEPNELFTKLIALARGFDIVSIEPMQSTKGSEKQEKPRPSSSGPGFRLRQNGGEGGIRTLGGR